MIGGGRRAAVGCLIAVGMGCGGIAILDDDLGGGAAGGGGEASNLPGSGAATDTGTGTGTVGGGGGGIGGSPGTEIACSSTTEPAKSGCEGCFNVQNGSKCAAQVQACLDDSSCLSFSECSSPCAGDAQCCADCAELTPSGAEVYSALIECSVCQGCTEECAGRFVGFSTCI